MDLPGIVHVQAILVSAWPIVTLKFALASMYTHMHKSAVQMVQMTADKEVEEEQRHCKQARLCHHAALFQSQGLTQPKY